MGRRKYRRQNGNPTQTKVAGHLFILKAYIDKRQLSTAVFYLYLLELQREERRRSEMMKERRGIKSGSPIVKL